MDGKELRHLNRKQLLEILLAQVNRIEELEGELSKMQKELNSKKIAIKESGSLAEATLKLSGLFEEADKTCQEYLENASKNAKAMERKTIKECKDLRSRMLEETEQKCFLKERKSEKRVKALEKRIAELDAILASKPQKSTRSVKRKRKGK